MQGIRSVTGAMGEHFSSGKAIQRSSERYWDMGRQGGGHIWRARGSQFTRLNWRKSPNSNIWDFFSVGGRKVLQMHLYLRFIFCGRQESPQMHHFFYSFLHHRPCLWLFSSFPNLLPFPHSILINVVKMISYYVDLQFDQMDTLVYWAVWKIEICWMSVSWRKFRTKSCGVLLPRSNSALLCRFVT